MSIYVNGQFHNSKLDPPTRGSFLKCLLSSTSKIPDLHSPEANQLSLIIWMEG